MVPEVLPMCGLRSKVLAFRRKCMQAEKAEFTKRPTVWAGVAGKVWATSH